MIRSTLALSLLAFALASSAFAQSATAPPLPLDQLKTELAVGKQTFIARSLALTPAEEAGFWPAYDELQSSLAEIEDKRREARSAIAAGSEDADDALENLVDADVEHAELLERAWGRMRGSVPAAKLARYLDLERQIAASKLF